MVRALDHRPHVQSSEFGRGSQTMRLRVAWSTIAVPPVEACAHRAAARHGASDRASAFMFQQLKLKLPRPAGESGRLVTGTRATGTGE
jgi:hypothetical protein